MSSLFILMQHVLPHHLLSRLTGKLASCKTVWLKNLLIKRFIQRYRVDMQQARHPDPEHYDCFNSFFTRELKPGLRPLPANPASIVSPADGAISAIGAIGDDRIFQAKGKHFSLSALLGGREDHAELFRGGLFATIYLSPRDYHRVHMPAAGVLKEMTYVPGKLFSVNQTTAENIDGLFARNERAVCLFETEHGPMAVILVGAMIVAGIETVWAGQVAPSAQGLHTTSYGNDRPPVQLARGEEMGRFKLGSTAIVLFGHGMAQWQDQLSCGTSLMMGEEIGTYFAR